jgi:hypothetical protein
MGIEHAEQWMSPGITFEAPGSRLKLCGSILLGEQCPQDFQMLHHPWIAIEDVYQP